MPNYLCEYCGTPSPSITMLTSMTCPRHPKGANQGKHKLYEGGEKRIYTCKYCGTTNPSLVNLTSMKCPHHPDGHSNGFHSPAL